MATDNEKRGSSGFGFPTMDLRDLNLRGFDMSKFELPQFDFGGLDFAKGDLGEFDFEDLDEMAERINAQLDEIEARLPPPADSIFRFQRAMASTGYAVSRTASESLTEAGSAVRKQAEESTEWFLDALRKQAETMQDDIERMAAATRKAMATVLGDLEEATEEAASEVDDLAPKVVNYRNWTKDELYDRAQELDITGRSSMTKTQLIKAIKAHDG